MQTLSRRERQIMEVLYERGRATAAEILTALPDPPSYSAIRTLIKILESKGHVKHEEDGLRYVFTPSIPRSKARRDAVKHLLQTFFDDSAVEAVAGLLELSAEKVKSEELDEIEELISRARKKQKSAESRGGGKRRDGFHPLSGTKAISLPLGFAILLSGCAGPGVYHYANSVLVPPGVKSANISQRTVTLPLAVKCKAPGEAVTLVPAGRGVRVAVKPAVLRDEPAGWLARWAESLERRGCFSEADGSILAAWVAEIVPLEPRIADRLLHPPEIAYVDLDPGSRLVAIGPLFRDGAKPDNHAIDSTSGDGLTLTVKASPDLVGVETAWYAVEPQGNGPGVRILFLSAEDREGDVVTYPDRPRLDYLHFAPDAAYYRLFTITRRSKSDHDMFVLAAATLAQLDQETKRVASDPSSCAELAASRACVAVPLDAVLSRTPVVTANGAAIAVQGRGTVRDVLMSAGVKEPMSVLSTLHIERRYLRGLAEVNFNPTQSAVLDLPLNGGEMLRW